MYPEPVVKYYMLVAGLRKIRRGWGWLDWKGNEGRICLFNDALITFYLLLYGVGHVAKGHLDSERGNPLLPLHGILSPISSKGSFICTFPQTG